MSASPSRKKYLEQYIINKQFTVMGKKTTICCITIYNGFEIIGTSSCVDAKDFNIDLGEAFAYERALEEMNKMFGFLEQDRAHINRS